MLLWWFERVRITIFKDLHPVRTSLFTHEKRDDTKPTACCSSRWPLLSKLFRSSYVALYNGRIPERFIINMWRGRKRRWKRVVPSIMGPQTEGGKIILRPVAERFRFLLYCYYCLYYKSARVICTQHICRISFWGVQCTIPIKSKSEKKIIIRCNFSVSVNTQT